MVLPDSHGICVVEGGSPSWMAHLPGPRDTASGSRQMAYTLAALYGTAQPVLVVNKRPGL